jgi:preprotein translocase subunit SecD
MASLLTPSQKQAIQSALSEVHDTFARDIFVYIEKQVATRPATLNYNPLYGRAKDSAKVSSQTELTKHTVKARVSYAPSQGESIVDAGAQFNLTASQGKIRNKIDSAGYEKVKDSTRIEIDDELYILDSDAKNLGPFSTQYYTVFLKREN